MTNGVSDGIQNSYLDEWSEAFARWVDLTKKFDVFEKNAVKAIMELVANDKVRRDSFPLLKNW